MFTTEQEHQILADYMECRYNSEMLFVYDLGLEDDDDEIDLEWAITNNEYYNNVFPDKDICSYEQWLKIIYNGEMTYDHFKWLDNEFKRGI